MGASPPLLPLAPQSNSRLRDWLFLLPSVGLTGIAHLTGGHSPFLTDLGFLWLSACCVGFILREISGFKTRQGWASLVMYGGVLIWFCHDYLKHWNTSLHIFGWEGTWAREYPEALPTIAWMAFLHCLFVTLMALGASFPVSDRITRWIHKYPDPPSLELFFWVTILGFASNIAFYLLFSYDNLYNTLWAAYFGGRLGQVGASVGFGGNLTTSLSAYLSLMVDTIGIAGTTGAAYAVFSKASYGKRTVAAIIFAHAMMLAYGSGTRSLVVAQGAPMVAFLVIRGLLDPGFRTTARAIVVALALLFAAMIQLQTHFRNQAYDVKLSDTRLINEVQGNTMFSEALDAYMEIPDKRPFFHNDWPGEGAVRAIPQMAFWFAWGPLPRPLLAMAGIEKPIDPAWAYRARAQDASQAQNNFGTTISFGLVGAWYFRFGIAGVVEGALLMGWLYAVAERMVRTAFLGRLQIMRLTIALSILSTLLLFYRDIVFFGIWRGIVMFVLVALFLKFIAPRFHFAR